MSKIKKPIYGPPELDESQMTPEQIGEAKRKETLHKIRERRIKKAFKTFRFRGLKNFLFWFFGVLSSVAIILGSVFIGVKVIPVNTYLKWAGKDSSEYVSEKIAQKSLIDAIFGISEYTFEDVPVIEKLVSDILAETGIDDFVVVDYTALKSVKFSNASEGSDLIDEVAKCIKINTSAEMFKDIKAFNEYSKVPSPLKMEEGTTWTLIEGKSADLYCYESVAGVGGEPMNAVFTGVDPTYEPMFVDGAINPKLASLTEEKMANVIFYMKPVCDLTALQVFNSIGEIIGNVEVADIISIVGAGETSGLIGKIFEGKTISSLTTEELDVSTMLGNVQFDDIGGIDSLGSLAQLPFFDKWTAVKEGDEPEIDSLTGAIKKITEGENEVFTSNPKLYYYESKAAEGENPAEYSPAFTDDGKYVDGAEGKQLYYPNLSKVSFGIVLDVIGDMIGYLDIVDLLSSFVNDLGEGDLVYDILVGTTINDLGDNFDTDSIMSKITLDTLGGADALNDLGKFSVFNEWEEVASADKPELVEGFITKNEKEGADPEFVSNPKLYYYESKAAEGENPAEYSRAFSDDGEWIVDAEYQATTLYYANLSVVSMSDMTELLGDSMGRLKLTNVLETFGASFGDDSIISKILGDKTIDQVGDIKPENIYLKDVMQDANEELKDILGQTVKDGGDAVAYENITLDMLSNFDIDGLKLTTVLPYYDTTVNPIVDNKGLYKILLEATGTEISKMSESEIETAAKLFTVGSLSDFEINNVRLSTAITDANQKLKDILGQTIKDGGGNAVAYENITIGMISSFDTNSLKLTTVLPFIDDNGTPNDLSDDKKVNEKLYNILLDALVDKDGNSLYNDPSEITVGGLSSFSVDGISLTTVLEPSDNNAKLYDVLKDVTGKTDVNNIKISSLVNFNTDSIKLSTVLPYYDTTANPNIDNKELYKVLLEATGTDISKMSDADIENAAKALKVGKINEFKIENVRLATAIKDTNKTLKNVLAQTVKNNGNDVAYDDITIGMLSSFNTDTLSLTTVLPYKDATKEIDNSSLYKILLEATGTDISKMSDTEIENVAETLTISKINEFKIENVRLATAMVADENGSYGNNILDALLTGENKDSVTIGNIGSKIGGVSLYDAYGKGCFTKDKNVSVDKDQSDEEKVRKFIFNAQENAFVHVTNQQIANQNIQQEDIYYIHENDGIWLLLCFDSVGYEDSEGLVFNEETGQLEQGMVDTDGRPEKYIISENTISSLENASVFKDLFEKTTVRQFVDSGIVDDGSGFSEKMYVLNISNALDMLNELLSNNG